MFSFFTFKVTFEIDLNTLVANITVTFDVIKVNEQILYN